jgi:Ca2+-transporting ATPase
MAYALSVHVPIAGLSLAPLVLGWPIALFPIHIVFIEMMIDPACSIAFEAEPAEPGVMQRPPRRIDAHLFDARLAWVSLLQGASVLGVALAAFRIGLAHTGTDDAGRALAFAALIGGNISLILANRSWGRTALATLRIRNAATWIVVCGAILLAALAFAVPAIRNAFRFGPTSADDLGLAALAGMLSLAWFEVVKQLRPAWLARA